MHTPTRLVRIDCDECPQPAQWLSPGLPAGERVPMCNDCAPAGYRVTPVPRIGRRMAQALLVIADAEGRTKAYTAAIVGPHGSLNYGYRTVDRLIAAGLAVACPIGRARYAVYLTQLGRRVQPLVWTR